MAKAAFDSDDLCSEEPDALYDQKVWERDLDLLRKSHTDIGVKEGIDKSYEHVIQEGFEKGFCLGASVGRRIGRFQSILRNLIYLASFSAERCKKILEHEADLIKIFNDFEGKLALKRIFTQGSTDYNAPPIESIKVDLSHLEEAECALFELLLKCNWKQPFERST